MLSLHCSTKNQSNQAKHRIKTRLLPLWSLHRTCSLLWSRVRPVRPMRTASSSLTSSFPTSTHLSPLCFATCPSAAAGSTPTSTTTARSASACWAPGLARWVLFWIGWSLTYQLKLIFTCFIVSKKSGKCLSGCNSKLLVRPITTLYIIKLYYFI